MKEVYIILSVVTIAYFLLLLWSCKNWRKSKHSELNARTRYKVIGELDEQIRRRKK